MEYRPLSLLDFQILKRKTSVEQTVRNALRDIYGLHMQLAQRIEGRQSVEEDGDGHCDKVLAIAAHPTQKLIASAGLTKDRAIKIWEDKI